MCNPDTMHEEMVLLEDLAKLTDFEITTATPEVPIRGELRPWEPAKTNYEITLKGDKSFKGTDLLSLLKEAVEYMNEPN
jgi:hypothetical protein